MKRIQIIAALVLLECWGCSVFGQVSLKPKNPDGLYKTGETATWTIAPTTQSTTQASYSFLKNGRRPPVKQETIDLSSGTATVEYTADEPGQVTLEVKSPEPATTSAPAASQLRGSGFPRDGAIFGVESIKPALPRPDDFDSWWASKLADLDAIPANPILDKVEAGTPGVEYYKVTLDNINQTRVQGQLAKPAKEGKFPALLQLQYAGVYPLQKQWVTDRARAGWLALNVLAHDMPIDDAQAIQKLARGELKSYQAIGNNDRESSYFLRMYLGDCQALKYLASRPDWDGQTLVVMGDSMGGQQSFATAGLMSDKYKISAMIAHVPAGGDVGAAGAGRSMAYPNWPNQPQVIETARYFDIVNFAPRIKTTCLVSFGLFDTTCPPTSVIAAFNQIDAPKEFIALHSDHGGPGQHPREVRRDEWLSALVKGQAVTPKFDH